MPGECQIRQRGEGGRGGEAAGGGEGDREECGEDEEEMSLKTAVQVIALVRLYSIE